MDNILDNLDLLAAYSNETIIIKKRSSQNRKKKNGEPVLGCIYCNFEPCLRKCLIWA
jgi:hypothetical protein